jgi:glutamate--cysteine ligase
LAHPSLPPLDASAIFDLVDQLFCASTAPKVGVELEFLSALPSGERPPQSLLRSIVADLHLPGGGRVTFEPGSAVELSSAPRATVADVLLDIGRDVDELRHALGDHGVALTAHGIDLGRAPVRTTTAARYEQMEVQFDRYSAAGRWMMNNTAALQINISNCMSEPFEQWRMLWRVAPLLSAIFANSAGNDANGKRWSSLRQGVWLSMDPARVGPVPLGSPADYAQFALDAAVLVIREGDGHRAPANPLTFAQWVDDPSLVGRVAESADVHYHLSTLFPSIRPKGWMEVRCIDMVPLHLVPAAMYVLSGLCRPDVVAAVLTEFTNVPTMRVAAERGLMDDDVARQSDRLMALAVAAAGDADAAAVIADFRGQFTSQRRCPGDANPIPAKVAPPLL